MKKIVALSLVALLFASCDTKNGGGSEPNNGVEVSGGDTVKMEEGDSLSVAVPVADAAHAELWSYLYSHEFVSDNNTLTFYKDNGYLNEKRILDGLQVCDNDGSASSIIGLVLPSGRQARLAVILDENMHAVVDMTDANNYVYYLEKEEE